MDEKDRDGYGGGERGRDRGDENYQRSYGGGRHHEEGNSTNGQDVRTHLFIFLFLCFFTLFFHGFTSDYFVKLYKFESLIMIVNFSLTSSIIFSLSFSLFSSLSLSLPVFSKPRRGELFSSSWEGYQMQMLKLMLSEGGREVRERVPGTYCVLQIEVLTLYFDSLIQYYNEMRKCDLWEEIAE